MDIQTFEEMILDYLDGNLSEAEKNSFEKTLKSSEECKEIFEHYRSIRNVSASDEELSPSGEVIERISNNVKESLKSEKRSFYERYLKFPVLAPTIAVVIIAMLWVSAGEDYLKNKNIIPVSEKSASNEFRPDYKASAGKLNQLETTSEIEEVPDKEVDNVSSYGKQDADVPEAAKMPSPSVGVHKKKEYAPKAVEEDSIANLKSEPLRQELQNKDIAKSIKSDDLLEKNEVFADSADASLSGIPEEKPAQEPLSVVMDDNSLKSETMKRSTTIGSSLSRSTKTTSSGSPSERVKITNNYRNELNEIVAMQYKGDCKQSLERAQKLLDSDPEPSVSIKTDLYVTQGECFMELKQYDEALSVYEKAKELTPHKSYLFNGKIKEIYIQQGK